MQKKKILVIGPGMDLGGVERSLIGLIDSFDYEKVDVDLFLFQHIGSLMKQINKNVNLLPENRIVANGYKHIKELLFNGNFLSTFLKCISLIIGKINRSYRKTGDDGKDAYQRIISRFIKINNKNYDLALGFIDPHYILLNSINSKVKIGWMHTDWQTIGSHSGTTIASDMWEPLDYIACVSEGVKKSFDYIFPQLSSKSIVIENILPTKYVQHLAHAFIPETEMPRDKFNILSVGRFSPPKNFHNAILCSKALHDAGINCRWYFIGYGPLENELKSLIKTIGAEDYAIILGKKDNPYPYMKWCDLYVQPSNYEGKSITVREAQALAKPVLITNYPTATSQLTNGIDGRICDLSNEAIVNDIKFLIKNKEYRNRLSENCRQQYFSGKDEIQKILNLSLI